MHVTTFMVFDPCQSIRSPPLRRKLASCHHVAHNQLHSVEDQIPFFRASNADEMGTPSVSLSTDCKVLSLSCS